MGIISALMNICGLPCLMVAVQAIDEINFSGTKCVYRFVYMADDFFQMSAATAW